MVQCFYGSHFLLYHQICYYKRSWSWATWDTIQNGLKSSMPNSALLTLETIHKHFSARLYCIVDKFCNFFKVSRNVWSFEIQKKYLLQFNAFTFKTSFVRYNFCGSSIDDMGYTIFFQISWCFYWMSIADEQIGENFTAMLQSIGIGSFRCMTT